MFKSFVSVAPMPQSSIERFGSQVPAELVEVWRTQGIGFIGGGYFRLVDPARAAAMLGTVTPLGPDSVVAFTTAMADLIVWWGNTWWVATLRLGSITNDPVSFDLLAMQMDDPKQWESFFQWQPYPAVRDRLGVPGFEDCFMHVPLLSVGGRGDAADMQVGWIWPHIVLMDQMTMMLNPQGLA